MQYAPTRHAGHIELGRDCCPTANLVSHPFFEATLSVLRSHTTRSSKPHPGPPVKTGARVRRFRGYNGNERHLTRERTIYTHTAPAWARQTLSQLREKRALARRREKAIDLGAQFFLHPPPSTSGTRPPHGGARSRCSLSLLNPITRGFWPRFVDHDQSRSRSHKMMQGGAGLLPPHRRAGG